MSRTQRPAPNAAGPAGSPASYRTRPTQTSESTSTSACLVGRYRRRPLGGRLSGAERIQRATKLSLHQALLGIPALGETPAAPPKAAWVLLFGSWGLQASDRRHSAIVAATISTLKAVAISIQGSYAEQVACSLLTILHQHSGIWRQALAVLLPSRTRCAMFSRRV